MKLISFILQKIIQGHSLVSIEPSLPKIKRYFKEKDLGFFLVSNVILLILFSSDCKLTIILINKLHFLKLIYLKNLANQLLFKKT